MHWLPVDESRPTTPIDRWLEKKHVEDSYVTTESYDKRWMALIALCFDGVVDITEEDA